MKHRKIAGLTSGTGTPIDAHTAIKRLKTKLEIHEAALHYFLPGDFYFYIFNLITRKMESISPGIMNVLGYIPDEITFDFLLSTIHSEDRIRFMNHEMETMKFLEGLPKDKIQKYKFQSDYRFCKKTGETVCILHQMTIIDQCSEGRPAYALCTHTDISSVKRNVGHTLSFIGLDGEPSCDDVKSYTCQKMIKKVLSRREWDIMDLLAKGKSYKEIAGDLFISPKTVRTHLHNIYKKLNVKSKVHALNAAELRKNIGYF